MISKNRKRMEEYGAELVAAGFQVWFVPMYPEHGFLEYRSPEGWWGLLQEDYWGTVEHSMPIVPSRENGSSMFIEEPLDVWTVEAARQCARPMQRNSVVGLQKNAGDRFRMASGAVPLHPVEAGAS